MTHRTAMRAAVTAAALMTLGLGLTACGSNGQPEETAESSSTPTPSETTVLQQDIADGVYADLAADIFDKIVVDSGTVTVTTVRLECEYDEETGSRTPAPKEGSPSVGELNDSQTTVVWSQEGTDESHRDGYPTDIVAEDDSVSLEGFSVMGNSVSGTLVEDFDTAFQQRVETECQG